VPFLVSLLLLSHRCHFTSCISSFSSYLFVPCHPLSAPVPTLWVWCLCALSVWLGRVGGYVLWTSPGLVDIVLSWYCSYVLHIFPIMCVHCYETFFILRLLYVQNKRRNVALCSKIYLHYLGGAFPCSILHILSKVNYVKLWCLLLFRLYVLPCVNMFSLFNVWYLLFDIFSHFY
jgi:hypothetical protein